MFEKKKTLRGCKIYRMLKGSKKHLSFHTPGHKKGKWDITELSYSDNLSSPRGCIAEAQKDIAALLGAERSYLLTDGSTAGVLSMLYAAKKLGVKKIAVCDQSHKSVFNGCTLLGITPLVYAAKWEGNLPLPPTMSSLKEEYAPLLEEADALFFTSPDYYGRVLDLAQIRAYCDDRGKLLLLDGAHGGHLHFDKKLYAGAYADMWVDGVHKSLPALTQGAVVSARSAPFGEALQEGVQIFRTTSPSYPVMASVEYAVKYPRNERLEKEARAYAKTPRVLLFEDWTKLCISFGKHAFAAQEALEKKGIYPEFCDGSVIEFYLSPAMKKNAFRKLKRELKKLFQKYPYEGETVIQRNPAPLLSTTDGEKIWAPLSHAKGKIAGADCGLFPPCTPLIRAGERIEQEKLDLLLAASNVYGVVDGKILIVEE